MLGFAVAIGILAMALRIADAPYTGRFVSNVIRRLLFFNGI
jgi:hypothetical protein